MKSNDDPIRQYIIDRLIVTTTDGERDVLYYILEEYNKHLKELKKNNEKNNLQKFKIYYDEFEQYVTMLGKDYTSHVHGKNALALAHRELHEFCTKNNITEYSVDIIRT